MSFTLRNELLMGTEHGSLTALALVGISFRFIVRKERLTGAFNLCYRPLPEGRLLKKINERTSYPVQCQC